MNEDFMQTFAVEPRVTEIKISKNVEINSGSSVKLTATVLPASAAEGKTVIIESLNPMIATVSPERVVADSDGNISFEVTGTIVGATSLKLSVLDYDLTETVHVEVLAPLAENQVATPYASVGSGTIVSGTKVYLYCATENANIYYTMDGSCPCDTGRLKYDGTPITVDKDVSLKIMAEADGMTDSEIAEYQYDITTTGLEELDSIQALSIYPLPLGEYLNISNGDHLIDSVSIYNIDGALIMYSHNPAKKVTMRVGGLSQGIYILNVKTNGRNIVKKVIKR